MSHNQYRDDSVDQRRAVVLGAWSKPSHKSSVTVTGNDGNSSQQLVEQEREERVRKYRPTFPKKIASWLTVGLGALGLINIGLPPQEGITFPVHLAMGLSMAMFFGLPGVYWLLCNNRDSKKIDRWIRSDAAYRDQLAVMSDSDRGLMAKPEEWPNIPKRQWPVVWTIVIIAFIAFSMVAPATT